MLRGVIFNIQRFSLHDGPGIRTTVFLKGCSLRCFWCHNPEGMSANIEVQFIPERCIGDMECARVCPHAAHQWVSNLHVFNRQVCDACGECVDVCMAEALEMSGREVSIDDVMAEVMADRAFYETSGGGVTLSGGDPMVQRKFSCALLKRCQEEQIHTALETAANCTWEHLAELLPFVDLVMLDIKHMDDRHHRQATGVSNRRILDNAKRLCEMGKPIIFRLPVIPGINDDPCNVIATATFIRELAEQGRGKGFYFDTAMVFELLPFHRLAEQKYRSLGWENRANMIQPPTKEHMETLTQLACSILADAGVVVRHR